MVSDAALARKQRFLELKEKHGDINSIQKYQASLPWQIWYNTNGDIVSISKEENAEFDNVYQKASFSNEQVKILLDKNLNLYRIATDEFNSTVKYIEAKPIESTKVISDDHFLYQVDTLTTRNYDIKVIVSRGHLIIEPHKNLLNKYKDIDKNNAVIKGRKIMPFYITTKNDPSFLLQSIQVSLTSLLTDKKVVIPLELEDDNFSVFTLKLFDSYHFNKEKK